MSIIEKMVVEAHQDQVLLGCQDHTQVVKGKRTKRQRSHSPLTLAMVSSFCSAVESGGGDGGELGERLSNNDNSGDGVDHHHHRLHGLQGAAASPTSSVDFATSTEEEEDMANCLILLAQGQTNQKLCAELQQPANIPTNSMGAAAAGLYVYECKTCNRCFPSFQALGGHRASHKKPKPNNDERKALVLMEEDQDDHYSNMSTTLSLQMANRTLYASTNNNKVNKVHECSICGAEFSSGQALGGHMRRHRASISTNTAAATTTTALSMATCSSLDQSPDAKKPRNLLQLDLNLPAPEDDRRESNFSFSSKEQVIVFSASSLVDCHY